jgi:predicted peroxiredoxin
LSTKAVISLTTGLEDPEKVTVAFLVAVGAAEQYRPTLMFLTKEAVRLALDGIAQGVACEGCPPLPELTKRYEAAGGRQLVCSICFNTRHLNDGGLVANATLGGTLPMWEWIATNSPPPSATEAAPDRRLGNCGNSACGNVGMAA